VFSIQSDLAQEGVTVAKERHQLNLGKGSAFVKSRFKRLRQEEETWEADFQALPKPITEFRTDYRGKVIAPDGSFLADSHVEGRPTVNHMAKLLYNTNYRGYLHADAFSGYDGLYLPDPRTASARIIEVACNAHARRKFYEARGTDALRSHQALAYYRQLYELERQAKDFSDEQRLQMRQELSLPILEQFHQWLLARRPEVLPKSPMGEAISYALNNWEALRRYTKAGFLAIDNNVAEREMK
jgi:hypothetical protein